MSHTLLGVTLNDRYEVLDKVGEGGMAVVYRARDLLLDRAVAVKALREQFASDEDFVARFRLEAQAAASLSHPNVVNIYDVGEDRGVHFIVMEHVEGENLKERLRREGSLAPAHATSIAAQIARALDAAHRRGLVHRDIKPHNILITRDGEVKVTDFGIARAASGASFTATGTVIGSVHYFAPEQARGDGVDAASDIYSLGVVLYEMVTGRLPFTGESPVGVALKHIHEDPRPAEEVNKAISPQLGRVIAKAMAKEKAQRHASAKEFLNDLLRLSDVGEIDHSDGEATVPFLPEATQIRRAASTDEAEWTRVRNRREDRGSMPSSQVQTPRKKRRTIALLIVVSFFAGLAWAAQKLPDLIFPQEVQVPDVRGLDLSAAQNRLAEFGLRLDSAVDDEWSSQVEPGLVIRQSPEAEQRVRMGRSIRVVVSRGPEFVIVPDVVGLPKIEAELAITQDNLTLGSVTEEYFPDVPPNTVIRQDPPAHTRLEKQKGVDIVVARGSQPQLMVEMPDVRGMSLEAARSRLQAQGFVEGQLHPEPHPTASSNEVIDQNPPPGELVEAGYPYSLAYATPIPTEAMDGQDVPSVDERYWENRVLINVPEGPPQEVVIAVIDEWGLRQVLRETRPGGSRFYHDVRIRGDQATIQVYFDGIQQLNEIVIRP